MKNKFKILIVSIILSFLLIQNTVLALVLGSEQKNTYAEVKPSQTAEFTILFWNIEELSFPINLKSRQVPENMLVTIQPEQFVINYSKVTNPSNEKGKEYVNTHYGLMQATPVKILVNVDDSVKSGEYSFYVTATAGKTTTGISVLFEKTYVLTVKVTEQPKPGIIQTISETSKYLINKTIEVVKESPSRITGMVTSTPANNNVILSFLSIISILIIAWFIYKRANL